MSTPKLDNMDEILSLLRSMGSEVNREGMGRYAIRIDHALGIKVTDLRKFARQVKKGHDLALQLWDSGIHEARILATIIDDPKAVTDGQMEQWAADFDSWDIVDQACNNLFRTTPLARVKAFQWAGQDDEYIKRAGFTMMAVLAVHGREAEDDFFHGCLDIVEYESSDERNYVKKAVNWALRQIGKRSPALREQALKSAERIRAKGTKSARWIANNALRVLNPKT